MKTTYLKTALLFSTFLITLIYFTPVESNAGAGFCGTTCSDLSGFNPVCCPPGGCSDVPPTNEVLCVGDETAGFLVTGGGCCLPDGFAEGDNCSCGGDPSSFIPIDFGQCMFADTGNDFECFCSGDGKNFFSIECTQADFDFCKNEVLGEVKRLVVVDEVTTSSSHDYSLNLMCSSVNGPFCGDGNLDPGEECEQDSDCTFSTEQCAGDCTCQD